jgi:hypothetical protein
MWLNSLFRYNVFVNILCLHLVDTYAEMNTKQFWLLNIRVLIVVCYVQPMNIVENNRLYFKEFFLRTISLPGETWRNIIQTQMHALQISERFKGCCYRFTSHEYLNTFPLGWTLFKWLGGQYVSVACVAWNNASETVKVVLVSTIRRHNFA